MASSRSLQSSSSFWQASSLFSAAKSELRKEETSWAAFSSAADSCEQKQVKSSTTAFFVQITPTQIQINLSQIQINLSQIQIHVERQIKG